MIDVLSVWALLISATPHKGDTNEPLEERAHRMAPIAGAIVTHARTREEAAAMVSSALHESRLASSIGPLGLGDGGRSIGYWQPQRRTCPGAWVSDPVLAVYASAECAARLFRNGFASCGNPRGAFTRYNGSPGCPRAEWADGRVRTFYWAYGKIRELS